MSGFRNIVTRLGSAGGAWNDGLDIFGCEGPDGLESGQEASSLVHQRINNLGGYYTVVTPFTSLTTGPLDGTNSVQLAVGTAWTGELVMTTPRTLGAIRNAPGAAVALRLKVSGTDGWGNQIFGFLSVLNNGNPNGSSAAFKTVTRIEVQGSASAPGTFTLIGVTSAPSGYGLKYILGRVNDVLSESISPYVVNPTIPGAVTGAFQIGSASDGNTVVPLGNDARGVYYPVGITDANNHIAEINYISNKIFVNK